MRQLQDLRDYGGLTLGFVRRYPLRAFLLLIIALAIIYFYGWLRLYGNDPMSIWHWAWARFLPQYNQEHSKIIPFVVLFLAWYHRDGLRSAPKQGNNLGLIFVAIAVLCYVAAARVVQPRVALFGLPLLLFGIVLFLWGKQVARILLFPCLLLFFLIPLGAIEQTTFRLQFLIIGVVKVLSRICGIGIQTIGTSIHSTSANWGFDIAEGCSGIRSLIAMIMLTALYVHFYQRVWWKKVVILAASVLFAIAGNAGRIFTIIVLARLGFPKFAGGIYHDWSSQLIFFPIALLTMLAFARLLSIGQDTETKPLGRKVEQEPISA
ncbi:MAG: exosortase/archaeosortase family protein [Verrucomicrobia bacterium]|nr:exosortase/archaeosortase family protein [Verrucomicrobiota bacterium]